VGDVIRDAKRHKNIVNGVASLSLVGVRGPMRNDTIVESAATATIRDDSGLRLDG
jgi:hypothetical protein